MPGLIHDFTRADEEPAWGQCGGRISPQAMSALRALTGNVELSAYIVFLGSVFVLLKEYTSTGDLVVWSPAYERLASPKGCTLPLRTSILPSDSFRSVLVRLKRTVIEAYAHQRFQAKFPEPVSQFMVCSRAIHDVVAAPREAQVVFEWAAAGRDPEFVVRYDRNLFRADCLETLAGHLASCLERLVFNLDSELSKFTAVGKVETRRLLEEFGSGPSVSFPESTLIHHIQVRERKHGERIAAVEGAQRRTYAELGARARRLGIWLQQRGVRRGQFVGVFVERGIAHLEAVLGLMQAGGVYVPVDPSYPSQRISFMMEDSGIETLITQTGLALCLPPETRARLKTIFYVDGVSQCKAFNEYSWEDLQAESGDGLPAADLIPDDYAYLLYTSGSTGMPKGALVFHRGAANHILAEAAHLGLNEDLCFMQSAPCSSDIAVWQLLGPLVLGGRTVIVDQNTFCNPEKVLQLIRREQITLMEAVPGWLQAFLDYAQLLPVAERDLGPLRQVIVTGERVDVSLINQWFRAFPQVPLINAYGPTEAADDVCQCCIEGPLMERLHHVPIGRPIANLRLYVLGPGLGLRPTGAAGEICIAGVGVGGGYWRQEERTSASFVQNPYRSGGSAPMLYKTGDLGRWLPDGNLEFLGRLDSQVKIRGFRIELGEIESSLARCDGVAQAVASTYEMEGNRQLLAYVVLKPGVTMDSVTAHMLTSLPAHMIPSIRVLERMPLLPSGKVDRKQLAATEPAVRDQQKSGQGPRTPAEALLVQIWSQLLRQPAVGIHENFFALGGDSILSIQMISRAARGGLRISPKQVFAHQTIAELAAAIQTQDQVSAEQGPLGGELSLLPSQHWFFEQPQIDCHHYNQAVMLKVAPGIDCGLVSRCMRELLIHHDALRLRFENGEHGWRQTYAVFEDNPVFTEVDLSSTADATWPEALSSQAAAAQSRLNLKSGPLLQVVWIHAPPGEMPRLLIAIHHLVVDGVSWRILLEDLQRGCEALREGAKLSFGLKSSSLREWSQALQRHVQQPGVQQQIRYWEEVVSQNAADLPADFPHANLAESARHITVTLTAEETRQLVQELAAEYQAPVIDILLTALACALRDWTGRSATLVDLEGHGREDLFAHLDITRTVGWFTSIYPVAIQIREGCSLVENLRLVQAQLRAVPNRGIEFGALRYLQPAGQESTLHSARRAQITFNYLGQIDQVLNPGGLFLPAPESVGPLESPARLRSYWLDINGSIAGGTLGVTWEYSANIHHSSTIQRLADRFIGCLKGLIEEATNRHSRVPERADSQPGDWGKGELAAALSKVEFQ